jgi:hypothetical protein
LGYDFTKKSKDSQQRGKKRKQDGMTQNGSNTSKMLLFAIEQSGSGPPKGTMNLDPCDEEGTAAFLRVIKNFINVRNPPLYDEIIFRGEGTDVNIPKTHIGNLLESNLNQKRKEMDGSYRISRSLMSPIVLFLHVDQGSFAKVGYTPYASPVANSRSVHKKHVEGVCKEVMNGKVVLSQEDYAIFGYQILLNEEDSPESAESCPVQYRCTLNRDNESNNSIVAKRAVPVTHKNLENVYRTVS